MASHFSTIDRLSLTELNKKLDLVRDRVRGVALGYHTGFFLGGRGGIGKSHCVLNELNRMHLGYRHWNSHITPRGLFDRLSQFPDVVHVLEDVEQLVANRQALGVLRSALWSVPRTADDSMERQVTWTVHGAAMEILFTGGIIMTTNRGLRDLPELNAFETRITWMELNVNEQEIASLMRDVASRGYRQGKISLSPDECIEVAEFVIQKSAGINKSLDMRLLINAFHDRVQFDDCEAGCCWQDLVTARIREYAPELGDVEPDGIRAAQRKRQLEVARRIVGLSREQRLRIWKEETGQSQATMYRRLEELARIDSQDFQS